LLRRQRKDLVAGQRGVRIRNGADENGVWGLCTWEGMGKKSYVRACVREINGNGMSSIIHGRARPCGGRLRLVRRRQTETCIYSFFFFWSQKHDIDMVFRLLPISFPTYRLSLMLSPYPSFFHLVTLAPFVVQPFLFLLACLAVGSIGNGDWLKDLGSSSAHVRGWGCRLGCVGFSPYIDTTFPFDSLYYWVRANVDDFHVCASIAWNVSLCPTSPVLNL